MKRINSARQLAADPIQCLERRTLLAASLFPNERYPTGRKPIDLAVADFNVDSRKDVATLNAGDNTITVSLAHDDGYAIAPELTIALPPLSGSMRPLGFTAGDFNADGQIDLAYGLYNVQNNLLVYHRTPTGWASPIVSTIVGTPDTIESADLNRDGVDDLVIGTNSLDPTSNGNLRIFHGSPSGLVSRPGLSGGAALAIRDINNDTYPDIAAAGAHGTLRVFYAIDNGLDFSAATSISVGGTSNPITALTTGDFNNDGKVDILVFNGTFRPLYANTTGGFTLQPAIWTPTFTSVKSLTVLDYTGDGIVDVQANGTIQNAPIPSLLYPAPLVGSSTGLSLNALLENYAAFRGVSTSADMNADGRLDEIGVDQSFNVLGVELMKPPGQFNPRLLAGFSTSPTAPYVEPIFADLTGDALDDLVVINGGIQGFAQYRPGLGNGLFGPTVQLSSTIPNSPTAAYTADADGDGLIDLLVANFSSLTVLRRGATGWASPQQTNFTTGTSALAVADLNGDGRAELMGLPFSVPNVVRVTSFNFASSTSSTSDLVVGDSSNIITQILPGNLNGDSATDLLIISRREGGNGWVWSMRVALNQGTGTFTLRPSVTITSPPATITSAPFVTLADLNADGALDIVFSVPADLYNDSVGTRPGTIEVWTNNGSAQFTRTSTLPGPLESNRVVAADYNRDGFTDLAILASTYGQSNLPSANTVSSTACLYLNRAGQGFQPASQFALDINPLNLRAIKANADDKPDLVITSYGRINVLLNNGDQIAPRASAGVYDVDSNAVSFTLTEPLKPSSVASSDLLVTNLTTGQSFAASSLALSDGNTTLRFTLPANLPDGNYRFTLPAASVTDYADNALASSRVVDGAFVLAGDLNRDRAVNFADLLILAQNYNQSDRSFSQGNLDRSADGVVGFSDLLILAQSYQTTLAAGSQPRASRRRKSLTAAVV
jgi:hypothetical protein